MCIYIYTPVYIYIWQCPINCGWAAHYNRSAEGQTKFKIWCVPMAVWSQFEEFGSILGLSGLELLVFRRPLVFKYRYDISSAPQIGPTTTLVLLDHIADIMTNSPAEGPVGGPARG